MPPKTIIRNAAPLVSVGILSPIVGQGGGYFLGKNPAAIKLYDIIIQMESPVLFPQLQTGEELDERINLIFEFLQCSVDKIFKTVSVHDLAVGDEQTLTRLKKQALNTIISAVTEFQPEANIEKQRKRKPS